MQDLIEKVEHAISYNVEGGLVEKYTWTELFNDMEKALEKEKEQIIEFGYKCRNKCKKESTLLPQDIFNQTYNQNKY